MKAEDFGSLDSRVSVLLRKIGGNYDLLRDLFWEGICGSCGVRANFGFRVWLFFVFSLRFVRA